MIFDHLVKHNGVYYPAGTDVPIKEEKAGDDPAISLGKVDETKTSKYTEEELNLPYMKLKSLAKQNGITVEKTAKAEEIKEKLRAL